VRKKKYFVVGRIQQPRQNKNLLYRHDKPNEPNKEGPLTFVLFESPFTSVSTVRRSLPSLVSFSNTVVYIQDIKKCSYIYRTDKKENKIFLIYKEIQRGAVAKPYMRKSSLIYEEMRKYLGI
jgi:hypothetical protein